MIKIKKETIIKKGDYLIHADGQKWEVKDIDGLYFIIANIQGKNQKQITKGQLMEANKWKMVIMDGRNYW